jgi:hypothetical protein
MISMAMFHGKLLDYQRVTHIFRLQPVRKPTTSQLQHLLRLHFGVVFFAIPNVFEHPLAGFNLALAACRGQWTVVLSLLTQWRQGLLVSKLRCQSSGWDGSLVNLQKANWKITIFNR